MSKRVPQWPPRSGLVQRVVRWVGLVLAEGRVSGGVDVGVRVVERGEGDGGGSWMWFYILW